MSEDQIDLDPLRDPASSRRSPPRTKFRARRRGRRSHDQPFLDSHSVQTEPPLRSTLARRQRSRASQPSQPPRPGRSEEEYGHHSVMGDGRRRPRQSQSASHQTSSMNRRPPEGYSLSGDFPLGSEQSVRTENGDSIKEQIRNLRAKGFSTGLARELATHALEFAYRIWVVDNSGSMQLTDGHRIVPKADGKITQQQVSRWEELQETVIYHAEMAATLESSTMFRLLNDPGPEVGPQEYFVRPGSASNDIRKMATAMYRAKPLGMTPLTSHILQIHQWLDPIAPQLRREGKRVAVILATDGLPTDEEGYVGDDITNDFVRALQAMEGLPIWLVIRLCTDEKNVTEFYNTLDSRFELSLEVLDDFLGEAKEVHRHNKWLNYSLPIHRCRELGYHDRLFDLIDERPLTRGELRRFCALLFGVDVHRIPDPDVNWKNFVYFVQASLSLEANQYDPMKKKILPLIHINSLNKTYGDGAKCSIM